MRSKSRPGRSAAIDARVIWPPAKSSVSAVTTSPGATRSTGSLSTSQRRCVGARGLITCSAICDREYGTCDRRCLAPFGAGICDSCVATTSTALPSAAGSRVRTRVTMRTRSARKRSCERSNGRPSASTTRCARSRRAARRRAPRAPAPRPRVAPTTSMRSSASPGAGRSRTRAARRASRRERAVEQAGEAVGREARALERDRLAVGEADAHDLEHERAAGQVERGGRLGVGPDRRGREHARADLEALPAQVRRAGWSRRVRSRSTLRSATNDAARAPAHAPHGARRLERVERRAQRRAADPVALGQVALGAQALARRRRAGRDLGRSRSRSAAADGPSGAKTAGSPGTSSVTARPLLAPRAPSATRAAIWPPSIVIVWPVM